LSGLWILGYKIYFEAHVIWRTGLIELLPHPMTRPVYEQPPTQINHFFSSDYVEITHPRVVGV